MANTFLSKDEEEKTNFKQKVKCLQNKRQTFLDTRLWSNPFQILVELALSRKFTTKPTKFREQNENRQRINHPALCRMINRKVLRFSYFK